MAVLTGEQIKRGYFSTIGGFPPAKIMKEVKDYKGETHLCVACTQLDYHYSESDQKRILSEWIVFLRTNTKAFKALHFNSRVPQRLFDAACCQENLEELRFKWGAYTDLTGLESLVKLKYLYIGSGAGVKDITSLGNLKNLIVLYVENFKRIEDYSPLAILEKLEQLVISGPILGITPIKDLEFLRDMQSLLSVWLPNTKIQRTYNSEELMNLHHHLPGLYDIYGCLWGEKYTR